jgi:short-subunit dehydrogenase
MKKWIIVSISSDIGTELAKSALASGSEVIGTYRKMNSGLEEMILDKKIELVELDMSDPASFTTQLEKICLLVNDWDVLVFATGTQEPIGNFSDLNFKEWSNGIEINLIKQLEILHRLLPIRRKDLVHEMGTPSVLFFAGGGTNNSVVNYSSYTLSKIALIKMCELLDTEILDVKFSIIGPGWVKTKIHQPTLDDKGIRTGDNYNKTKQMLEGDDCVSMTSVVNSCNWIIDQDRKIVSGRNFSTKNDAWGNEQLIKALENNSEMYKLRRAFNNWKED